MPSVEFRKFLKDLFSPLQIAAYVAWGVVWLTVIGGVAKNHPAQLPMVQLAMLLFLLGFALASAAAIKVLNRPWRAPLVFLLMGVCALYVISLQPWGTSNILLVLLATVMAAKLELRAVLLSLAAINLVVCRLIFDNNGGNWQSALQATVAFISFQAFAVLVMRNTWRAEQMAENLRATNAELLTTRLLLAESVRDQERLRMSRELHDVAGHGLTALKLNLNVLARDLQQGDRQRVQLCAQLADELLQNLRAVVQQLRADPGLDLHSALQKIALPFPRPSLRLSLPASLPDLSFAQVEALMRAVQEALTNAARHSAASLLEVCIVAENDQLRLHIRDDGRAPSTIRCGGGLSGMRERFEELGGSLNVSVAAGGLDLDARFPLQLPAAAGAAPSALGAAA